MQLGFIGLGRMGGNMTRRLAAAGHTVAAWDRNPDAVRAASNTKGIAAAASIEASLIRRSPSAKHSVRAFVLGSRRSSAWCFRSGSWRRSRSAHRFQS